MTSARLLSSFVVGSSWVLRVTHDINTFDVSITAGTYWWGCDGGASDFAARLKTNLENTFSLLGGHTMDTTWTVGIVGVDQTYASTADGRVYISESGANWQIQFNHANTTDALIRILGATDNPLPNPAGTLYISPHVHRYGWYPQDVPRTDIIRQIADRIAPMSSNRIVDVVEWGRYDTIALTFDWRPSALVRTSAAAESARATPWNLTAGDLNCAYEEFGYDLGDGTRTARYYPDETVTGTYYPADGYIFPRNDVQWMDPLAKSTIANPAGEKWHVEIQGISP